MRLVLILPLLAACASSENPADGGFLSGVQNISDGTYERRVEEREATVDEGREETAALETEREDVAEETARVEAELARAEGEVEAARRDLVRLRYEAEVSGREVPADLRTDIEEATTAEVTATDPQERLDELRGRLASMRVLAERLSELSG